MSFSDGILGVVERYSASKIVAHQATERFVQEQNPYYDVITLHPTFVLGRNLVQKTAGGLNTMGNLNGW